MSRRSYPTSSTASSPRPPPTATERCGREDVPSLAFEITPAAVATPEGTTWVSRFAFTGQEAARSVRDLLRDTNTGVEEKTAQREIDEWLLDYLRDSGGAAWAREVIDAGRVAGFSECAIKKARMRVKATSEREGFGRASRVRWSTGSTGSHPHVREPMEPVGRVPDLTPPRPCSDCGFLTSDVVGLCHRCEAREVRFHGLGELLARPTGAGTF